MEDEKELELTILMPCLNEAETLGTCIRKAQTYLAGRPDIAGEILIADNGSTDGSAEIALEAGARVVHVTEEKGYGAAVAGGLRDARGKYVIIGDADDSYDFLHLDGFVEKLREGYDLVMGNRFAGGIAPGAMPWSHRYIGNPVLSWIGRVLYPCSIHDFHCGLRGCRREAVLDSCCPGMEYASEMVVRSVLKKLKITEIPTTLAPDGRSRPPHLRSFPDGWRHLVFLLIHAPDWLYRFSGAVLGVFGLGLLLAPLLFHSLGFGCMLFGAGMVLAGGTGQCFYRLSILYAAESGFIPVDKNRAERYNANRTIGAGAVLALAGVCVSAGALLTGSMAAALWGVLLLCLGALWLYAGFFAAVLVSPDGHF